MGYTKDRMMQEDEQGWKFSDNRVCSRCIAEPYLKQRLKDAATDVEPCSFCRRRPSVPLDDVIEIVGSTVADYYNRAVNEAGYDGREGGYQGTTFDTWEVMDDIAGGVSKRDDVLTAIHESFDDDIWVERNMYSLTGERMYIASWDEFCDSAREEAEYGPEYDHRDQDPDVISVSEMLDALQEIIQGAGLIATLPADLTIYRVRVHPRSERCDSRETLGPPPSDVAPTNRMSRAGTSVFYGAFERATATVEASVSMPPDPKLVLTAAEWMCSRPINVLDLTTLPRVPTSLRFRVMNGVPTCSSGTL